MLTESVVYLAKFEFNNRALYDEAQKLCINKKNKCRRIGLSPNGLCIEPIETDSTAYAVGGSTFFLNEDVTPLSSKDVAVASSSTTKIFQSSCNQLWVYMAQMINDCYLDNKACMYLREKGIAIEGSGKTFFSTNLNRMEIDSHLVKCAEPLTLDQAYALLKIAKKQKVDETKTLNKQYAVIYRMSFSELSSYDERRYILSSNDAKRFNQDKSKSKQPLLPPVVKKALMPPNPIPSTSESAPATAESKQGLSTAKSTIKPSKPPTPPKPKPMLSTPKQALMPPKPIPSTSESGSAVAASKHGLSTVKPELPPKPELPSKPKPKS